MGSNIVYLVADGRIKLETETNKICYLDDDEFLGPSKQNEIIEKDNIIDDNKIINNIETNID